MNLLFLSHRLPFPPNKGDKIRSHALFAHLAARHTVNLGCFIDEAADFGYAHKVRDMVSSCMMVPLTRRQKLLRSGLAFLTGSSITAELYRSAKMQRWVDDMLQSGAVDCAIIFSSSMASYLLSGNQSYSRRVLFDMVDLDSDKWRQYANTVSIFTSWIYRREAKKLLELERLAAESFALTYLVSPYEARSFSLLAPESISRIKTLCNGVNLDYFSPGKYASPFPKRCVPIVMTGRMDYWPNVEGALWFAREVLPLVKQRIGNVRFYAVGAHPSKTLRNISSFDVEVTGEVSDIRPYIACASAVVAPLRIARGVQNKVLEALAMSVPIVATVEASRALTALGGRDLWVANDAIEFADAVVEAVGSASRDAIAANGRFYVEKHHNWTELLSQLDEALGDLAASSPKRGKIVAPCL